MAALSFYKYLLNCGNYTPVLFNNIYCLASIVMLTTADDSILKYQSSKEQEKYEFTRADNIIMLVLQLKSTVFPKHRWYFIQALFRDCCFWFCILATRGCLVEKILYQYRFLNSSLGFQRLRRSRRARNLARFFKTIPKVCRARRVSIIIIIILIIIIINVREKKISRKVASLRLQRVSV